MSNTHTASEAAGKTVLSKGEGSAIRVLVGIKLGILSSLCEKDAVSLLRGKGIHPSHIGNLHAQATLALNAIIEKRLITEAKKEGVFLVEHYGLVGMAAA